MPAAVAGGPDHVLLLVAAVLSTLGMMLGPRSCHGGSDELAHSRPGDHLPVSLGAVAVTNWVAVTGTEELTLLKRPLPGGAATELVERRRSRAGDDAGGSVPRGP
ncbi:hypothetical protein [Streptomyces sp. NPDC057302]|uniref:hypothetical protein n=1 Tax=Streptomyces sp. NPDC057302 TaxID=3346094 RepID=UPI0036331F26